MSTAGPSPSLAPTNAPPPTASPPTGTEELAQTEEWGSYTTDQGRVTFGLPPGWTVEEEIATTADSADGGQERLIARIYDSDYLRLTFANWPAEEDPACDSPAPYVTLDWRPLTFESAERDHSGAVSPRAVFRAVQVENGWLTSLGITDTIAGAGGTTCSLPNSLTPKSWTEPIYFGYPLIAHSRNGLTVPTLDHARAYIGTPHYEENMAVLTSLTINDAP